MARASLLLLVQALALLHSCAAQSRTANISAVEAAVRDRAFELLCRTSQLVEVPLPGNLTAGVEASALRVRSNELWADGVNATAGLGLGFAIPPRVVPAPFARRVTIIFERFVGDGDGDPAGAASAAFAAPRGYALAAPVVGLLAYDASRGADGRLVLQALRAPVRVEFKNASSANGFNATTARCLTFAAGGEVAATHAVVAGSACEVSGTGHFGVAVWAPETPPPPLAVRAKWWAWTVGVGAAGVLGASFLVLSVAGAVRWSRRRREEMELRALAGEELGRMTVLGSWMPSAKVVRTRPELEEGSPPPWRKT